LFAKEQTVLLMRDSSRDSSTLMKQTNNWNSMLKSDSVLC